MKLRALLDLLIPRFVTEDAALEIHCCGDCQTEHYRPVCALQDVRPGEVFDGIATIRFLNVFGLALFGRSVGEVRPWVNPHDAKAPA